MVSSRSTLQRETLRPTALINYWNDQTTFVDGLAQETCRDFQHTAMGVAGIINLAETAYIQGYSRYYDYYEERIVKGMEFHAKYQNGAGVSFSAL